MTLLHRSAAGHYAVRGEITKQLAVIGMIAGLGIWQHHFVIQAASADVYLFVLLFGAGFYGIYNAVAGTHRLANEFVALEAMKEVYEDALWIKRSESEALDAQFSRTTRPGIVYQVPHVLATAHNLIVEEVQRNGSFRIPTGTMQVLVADVEGKLDDRQGMSHYLGALMVLLGLLGTFIGLMHTLESVGGILGSLDLSGSAGAGAIASLIESLKHPLEGMSTGFGASLFGLIGSLIIGFLSKVDTKAAFRLKHEFETWIRSTVQIEGATRDAPAVASGSVRAADSPATELNSRTMLRVARSTVLTTSRLADQIQNLASAVEDTHRQLAAHNDTLDRIVTTAIQSQAVQAATERHVLALTEEAAAAQQMFGRIFERLNHLFDTQQRANEILSAGHRQEGQRLRETIEGTAQVLQQVHRAATSMEAGMAHLSDASAKRAEVSRKNPTTPPDIEALVADLDHLISVSRLRPSDVHNLRKLSALLVDPDGDGMPAGLGGRDIQRAAS